MLIRTLIPACICIIALVGIHCSRGKDRAQPDASTVTVLYDGDEWLLGPAWNENPQFLMFRSLVNWNEGVLEGLLAERWEHSPDYRTWTYYLRRDVRWHDGVPVTAHDVKFTLELLAHPAVLATNNELWRDMESVTVLDEFTFTITYTRPRDAHGDDDWSAFYPKHLLEDLDPKEFYRWDFWTHPIGNGPFRYVRHVPKTIMELEANPDFYRGKPKIERVVFKFGGGAPLTELLSGNVDVVPHFNPADIPKLGADDRFRVYQVPQFWRLFPIHWNHRHPLFRDLMVRRALTLAINRRELAQIQNYPENTPIFDVIFTVRQLRRGELPDPLPYDPERAKQLLEEAGWSDQDGDGIRERAGEEASFTALVHTEEMVQPAIYVQAQLLQVGIQMDVRPLASGALRARLRAGEFEAVFDRFQNWPRSILQYKWFSPGSPIGYTNPQIVKLLQAALIAFDFEARDQIYRELMAIFHEELPMTFLFPSMRTHVAHRRLRGLENSPWPNPIGKLAELWLEEEK